MKPGLHSDSCFFRTQFPEKRTALKATRTQNKKQQSHEDSAQYYSPEIITKVTAPQSPECCSIYERYGTVWLPSGVIATDAEGRPLAGAA